MNLTELRHKINQAISGSDFESVTYFAGGCVRDYLMGRATQDYDLCVELNQGATLLAEYLFQRGLCEKPVLYPAFGTAKITMSGHNLELVMTRSEVYPEHSRHPQVRFAPLKADVLRRDFTINALLMRVYDGEILDLCEQGMADISNCIVRAVGKPDVIFREDPLRMLRAIRFAVTLGFVIEPETMKGIRGNASEIRYISRKRRQAEYANILGDKHYDEGIRLLSSCGLPQKI